MGDTEKDSGACPSGTSDQNLCKADAMTSNPIDESGVAAGYTDNCGVVTAAIRDTAMTGNDCSWTVTYTYDVSDECGNSVT